MLASYGGQGQFFKKSLFLGGENKMLTRIETLFALMVNTELNCKIFDNVDNVSFEDIIIKAVGWPIQDELVFGNDKNDIWIHKNGTIHIIRVEKKIIVHGAWPINQSDILEDPKDLLMTSLVMYLWELQPEKDKEQIAKGKLGCGIIPFSKFDLKGLRANIHKITEQLRNLGISLRSVLENAEKFDAWNKSNYIL